MTACGIAIAVAAAVDISRSAIVAGAALGGAVGRLAQSLLEQ